MCFSGSEICRRFPELEILDKHDIAQVIRFDVPRSRKTGSVTVFKVFLFSTIVLSDAQRQRALGSYFQDSTKDVTVAFLNRYFEHFDTNRDGLLAVYDDRYSFFSLQATTTNRSGGLIYGLLVS